ncbi:MAG: hypothetical protein RL497_812 [Pseudomonadota bacterium]
MLQAADKVDVVHFVTGGFSGATMVARQLVAAANNHSGGKQHLLVLRKKRQTQASQLQELSAQQIPYLLVPGWSHLATIFSLILILKRLNPRVLIAHGFSEHLWGRLAAVLAGVPVIIHVEHNSKERYTFFRLWLAKQLAKRTRWIVGVSEGVCNELIRLGFPREKCTFVNNGIDMEIYKQLPLPEFSARKNAVIMCARFARQKDHATLIKAIAHLKDRGEVVELALLGGGKTSIKQRMIKLCAQLGVAEQVHFLGHSNQVPQLLAQHKIAALITHYEGMPLALVEAMAAGCAVVASQVVGVQELLALGLGTAVKPGDADHLANQISFLFNNPKIAAESAQKSQHYALKHFTLSNMLAGYNTLIE